MKKIAFIGIRGIPVVYSGFESFVEDLTSNVKGFDFTVYCRKKYVQKKRFNNVKLIYTPTLYLYKLETFIHSFFSTIHAVFFLKPHIIFYLSVGNAPFLIIPRLFGVKTIINVNGMDWDREKWGKFGKLYLSTCAFISTQLADIVVTDSTYSQDYYKRQFRYNSTYIPYMSNGYKWKENKKIIKKHNLHREDYFVWAGRFVPDNHLDDLLHAFTTLHKIERRLVVIGDDNYSTSYVKTIKRIAKVDKRIVLTGFIPRDDYLTLLKNSYAYIETKQSGGTHPSLLEGLNYAPRVICNDFSVNKKISKNKAVFYINRSVLDLKRVLSRHLPISERAFIHPRYQINNIIKEYKQLFTRV